MLQVSFSISKLGGVSSAGYNVTDVFTGQALGMFKPQDQVTALVNPTGIFLGLATFIGN